MFTMRTKEKNGHSGCFSIVFVNFNRKYGNYLVSFEIYLYYTANCTKDSPLNLNTIEHFKKYCMELKICISTKFISETLVSKFPLVY